MPETDVLYLLPIDPQEKAARLYELAHLHSVLEIKINEQQQRFLHEAGLAGMRGEMVHARIDAYKELLAETEERIAHIKAVKFD